MIYPDLYNEIAQEIAGLYFEAGQLIGHDNSRALHAQTMAQLDQSALASVLIEKGLFTQEEYNAALIASAAVARDKVNAWLLRIANIKAAAVSGNGQEGGEIDEITS